MGPSRFMPVLFLSRNIWWGDPMQSQRTGPTRLRRAGLNRVSAEQPVPGSSSSDRPVKNFSEFQIYLYSNWFRRLTLAGGASLQYFLYPRFEAVPYLIEILVASIVECGENY
jgi:hypothetical protein